MTQSENTNTTTSLADGLKAAAVLVLILGAVMAVIFYAGVQTGRAKAIAAIDTTTHYVNVPFVPPAVRETLQAALTWRPIALASRAEAARWQRAYRELRTTVITTMTTPTTETASQQDSAGPVALATDTTVVYTPVATADTSVGGFALHAAYWYPPVDRFMFDIEQDTVWKRVPEKAVTITTEGMDAGDWLKAGLIGGAVVLVLEHTVFR